MNDIEILEEFRKSIKNFNNYADNTNVSLINKKQVKAIENLIQRNKDLEQIEKEHKEENGRLREKVKELVKADLTIVYMDGFYDAEKKWKDKIREKIKELEKEYEEYKDSQEWEIFDETKYAYELLQELLEESEK